MDDAPRLRSVFLAMTTGDFRHAEDRHDWHELVCPLEAGYRVRVDGRELTASAGEVFCFPAGAVHAPRITRDLRHRLLVLQWHDRRVGWADDRRVLVADRQGRLVGGLRWLLDASTDGGEAAAQVVAGLLPALLGEHRRLSLAAGGAADGSALATRVAAYIRADMHRDLHLAELARSEGLSVRQLHRRLVAEAGITPGRMIQELRIEAALHLAESGLPMAEIARRVGHASAQHLARLLRRRTGRRSR